MVDTHARNRRTALRLLAATLAMFAFGYALVPLYNVFCEVTGINGKTARITAQQADGKSVDRDRLVTVEFVTSTAAGMPWEFRPTVKKVQVHPGEAKEVEFLARNVSGRAVVGQAVPSVAPNEAARYFQKTECFCFTRQPLAAREKKMMPVRFIVDPALPADVSTLTLSYTFFHAPETAATD